MPNHLNPDDLHDKQISLKSNSKRQQPILLSSYNSITRNSIKRNYQPQITKQKNNPKHLTILDHDDHGNFALKNLECKGEIRFVEAVDVPPIGDIEVPPKLFVKPPRDLYRRHPLFGMNVPEFQKTSICDIIPSEEIKVEANENEAKVENKSESSQVYDKVEFVDGECVKVKIEEE